MYPIPANEYLIDASSPRVLIIAIACAVDPIPILVSNQTGFIVTFGTIP